MAKIIKRNVQRNYKRNKDIIGGSISSYVSSIGGGSSSDLGNYLPAFINDDGSYTVELDKVFFKGAIVASGDISCFGEGESAPLPTITVIDSLSSQSTTEALSANQGRILKSLIDSISGSPDTSLFYTKKETDDKLIKKSDIGHTHPQYLTDHQSLENYATQSYVTAYVADTINNISSLHTHDNKNVLDRISSGDVTNWNGKLNKSVWDANLYVHTDDTLHSRKSFVSDGEISCYSDKRLKSNIHTLNDRGFITPKTFIKDGKEQIGFIAQDVQEKYPELVKTDGEDGLLMLNYSQYTAVLQAQIINLQKQIDKLNKLVNQLENKLVKDGISK